MEPQQEGPHPDPVTQATTSAGQKLAEFAAVAALLAQVTAQFRARRAQQDADRTALEDADRAAARARWAPALDRGWLADADLRDVARAWGSALPYEDTDAAAREALNAAEARLREIHPYGMRAYDKLRDGGRARAEAMREAAPEFLKHPRPRPAPRDAHQGRYLTAPAPTAGGPAAAPAPPDPDAAAAARLLDIVSRINDSEIAAGRGPLDPAVVEMALAARTSAPPGLITRIVEGLRDGSLAVPAAAARAPRPTVAAAGPGALDWPRPAADGVAVVVVRQAAGGQAPRRTRGARSAPPAAKRPKLHP